MLSDAAFYRQWILANGWAEAVGLGTTFAIGGALAPLLDRNPSILVILAGALAAVLLGTFLEGVLIGVAQAAVIRKRLSDLRPRTWIIATAVGAGLAWLLGMVPSTAMALQSLGSDASPPSEPSAMVQYIMAAALGLVAGPILGLAQWTVLRRHVPHAIRWLWANALAWAIGMPLIFLGMDHMPWTARPVVLLVAIYALCGATGLVVGAVHGRVLVGLTQSRVATSSAV